MKIKTIKEVKFMYPELTTKITILYAVDVTTSKGNSYVNVSFPDHRGNPRSMYFPPEFSQFAKDHLGQTVTAIMRYWPPYGDRPANLSGVSLK